MRDMACESEKWRLKLIVQTFLLHNRFHLSHTKTKTTVASFLDVTVQKEIRQGCDPSQYVTDIFCLSKDMLIVFTYKDKQSDQ